jgi:hypothetical protein
MNIHYWGGDESPVDEEEGDHQKGAHGSSRSHALHVSDKDGRDHRADREAQAAAHIEYHNIGR